MSHQVCPPCLVLPVRGRAWESGGEGGGGGNVPGLTLIIHNFQTNKQNSTNPDIFVKFDRINSLLY